MNRFLIVPIVFAALAVWFLFLAAAEGLKKNRNNAKFQTRMRIGIIFAVVSVCVFLFRYHPP